MLFSSQMHPGGHLVGLAWGFNIHSFSSLTVVLHHAAFLPGIFCPKGWTQSNAKATENKANTTNSKSSQTFLKERYETVTQKRKTLEGILDTILLLDHDLSHRMPSWA